MMMTEHEMADILTDLVRGDRLDVDGASTFEEAGVLTRNAGLVVRMMDGTEFQVTIVKSR